MAGNTQIDPKTEGGLFSLLHGLTGYAVAVVLLLSILGVLTYLAIATQQANATNFYTINQDLNALKMNSPDNHKMWINEKDK
jgi:succinate dehydrogenase/fumarate reductase cytochrome b subunit